MYESDMFSKEDILNNEKKALSEVKRSITNRHTVTKKFNGEWRGKFYRTVTFSYFGTSATSGNRIIHAITGATTNFIIGRKKDESRFFKVVMANGENATGPVHLFYNSPEEYENHQYLELDQTIKDKWFSNFTK